MVSGPAYFYSSYIAAVLAVLLKGMANGELVVRAEDVDLFLDHPVTLSITKRDEFIVITFSHSDLPDGPVN